MTKEPLWQTILGGSLVFLALPIMAALVEVLR